MCPLICHQRYVLFLLEEYKCFGNGLSYNKIKFESTSVSGLNVRGENKYLLILPGFSWVLSVHIEK